MNNINLHMMRASGKLEPMLEIIKEIEQNYLPKVVKELEVSNVDIIICVDPNRAIPETGVGGWAHNANLLSVYIDPDSKGLDERLAFSLKSTLAHELNHVTRWRNIGYKYTLLESIVSDGLADHFDIFMNGGAPRPWDRALSDEDLKKYYDKAKLIWNDEQYDHAQWYFGTGDIPRWTGYSLGFELIGDYIEGVGEWNFKTLVRLPAETFIK